MRLLSLFLLASTATLPAFFQTSPSGQDERPDKPPATGDAKQIDTFLATWLVVEGNNSLALAQLALQKATDPEVKAFAQMMIDDHRPFLQELTPFAGGAASGALGRPDQPNPVQNASFHSDGAFDHVGLIKDLGAQCLSSSRKELDAKQGAEFDRCFMGLAVVGHMRAHDMLTVFQEYASDPLDEVLGEGQETIGTHLQKAKDGARKLEGKAVAAHGTTRK